MPETPIPKNEDSSSTHEWTLRLRSYLKGHLGERVFDAAYVCVLGAVCVWGGEWAYYSERILYMNVRCGWVVVQRLGERVFDSKSVCESGTTCYKHTCVCLS